MRLEILDIFFFVSIQGIPQLSSILKSILSGIIDIFFSLLTKNIKELVKDMSGDFHWFFRHGFASCHAQFSHGLNRYQAGFVNSALAIQTYTKSCRETLSGFVSHLGSCESAQTNILSSNQFQLMPLGENCCPRWFKTREFPLEAEVRAGRYFMSLFRWMTSNLPIFPCNTSYDQDRTLTGSG